MSNKKWINARELADLFDISVPTLYRWLAKRGSTNVLRRIPDKWVFGRRYWNRTVAIKIAKKL
jgi:predicted DNA-binding transcriptional regulator AlpA